MKFALRHLLALSVLACGFAALTAAAQTPTVTSVSPIAGPAGGGNGVTVNGTNLSGATAVNFGGTPGTAVTNISSTQVSAVAPNLPAGTTADITVVATGGTSTDDPPKNHYFFVAPPTVTGVSATASGATVGPLGGGNTVTITGTGFTAGGLVDATAVMFGPNAAPSFKVVNDTEITATAPGGVVGTIDITVAIGAVTSTPNPPHDQYTYVVTPVVSSISPTGGPVTPGTTVTIAGSGFSGVNSATTGTVTFGTVAAPLFVVDSDNQIRAKAPAHSAGPVDITVAIGAAVSATSAADVYTYGTAPAVTAISPNTGPVPGGTAVTITGTALTGATSVMFGTTAATSVVVVSATKITAISPPGAAGAAVDVTVTTPVGTSPTSAADMFTRSKSVV